MQGTFLPGCFFHQVEILCLADSVAFDAGWRGAPRQMIDREVVASVIAVKDVRSGRNLTFDISGMGGAAFCNSGGIGMRSGL